MPLYEFECIKCRNNVEKSLKALERKRDKETVKASSRNTTTSTP